MHHLWWKLDPLRVRRSNVEVYLPRGNTRSLETCPSCSFHLPFESPMRSLTPFVQLKDAGARIAPGVGGGSGWNEFQVETLFVNIILIHFDQAFLSNLPAFDLKSSSHLNETHNSNFALSQVMLKTLGNSHSPWKVMSQHSHLHRAWE